MAAIMAITDDEISTPTKSRVRGAFEKWARWREGARYYGSSAAPGLLSRLREGRGTVVCPTCKGDGRMPGYLVGSHYEFLKVPCPGCDGQKRVDGDLAAKRRTREIDCVFCARTYPRSGRTVSTGELPDGRTCHKCQGGRRLLVELEVHPATIKGTRYLGPDAEPDPVVTLVDRTVRSWSERNETYWLGRVVIEEYCKNGTQEMKATRLGVSRVWYAKNLIAAHQRMAEEMKKLTSGID